jgi:hypothetical protein
MKKAYLLLVFLILISSFLSAQQADLKTYVLHFTDKGMDKYASLNPSLFLTEKSVERRLKHKIEFDQSDLPVNEQYVQDIITTGARVLARSRWLNTIVIEANAEMLNKITVLPQILKIQPIINPSLKQISPSEFLKPSFEVENTSPWSIGKSSVGTDDTYEYGAAFNQINQINGQYLHNLGYMGEGMTIAVLDAGFNSVDIMPCFESMRANNQIKGTRDFAQPGNNVYATTMASHGSSVLSCMAAFSEGQMVGTAPKADYWLLRSEVATTESIIEEYYWVSAAEFADSVGADLINSSLGYTTFPNSPEADHTYADMDGNTTVVTKGADKAAAKGILVVNSAGNSGGVAWKFIGAPADGDSVFSIGSVNATGTRSSFSSIGPTSDGQIKPTVVAQGSGTAIFTPSGLVSGNGTSFSSPIICGMTACLWQAFPQMNNMQLIELIKATSSNASLPDNLIGWGIPDFQYASTTVSIDEKMNRKDFLIYPNPVVDKVTLGFPFQVYGKLSIEIVNLQGKIVYKKQLSDTSVRSIQINDIGYLPSGIYFIKVSDRSVTYTGKIIKM